MCIAQRKAARGCWLGITTLTQAADGGGADRGGDVVVARRNVSGQRPQRVERRLQVRGKRRIDNY